MAFSDISQHLNPGRLVLGPGAIKQIPDFLDASAKLLLVSDQGVVSAGILEKIEEILNQAGVSFSVYDQVLPDAPLATIEQAAAQYREQGCSALLAVGGGSAIDSAKAVGVDIAQPGGIAAAAQGVVLESPIPPMIAIPTTAGTGSEVTGVAVVADHENQTKIVVRGGDMLKPQVAILDPDLLASLPPRVAAETGADALSHAMEALVSRNNQPFADAHALHAIRLIFTNLRTMVGDPSRIEAGVNMLAASTLAGQAFANVGLGLTHSLAHPLGAHYHVGHGLACAMYLPLIMEFNSLAAAPRYRLAAEAMGQDVRGLSDMEAAGAAVLAVEELFEDVGIPLSYGQLGIDFELKDEMVEEVLGVPTRALNPRVSTREDIVALFMAPC
jgi:alcohol dehydrogenase class IV